MSTDKIGEYTPVRIDTTADGELAFEEKSKGVSVFAPPLEDAGGMSAVFLQVTTTKAYAFTGNYLLVLEGSCVIQGVSYAVGMLVVGKDVAPRAYSVAAAAKGSCLALGVSF